MWRDIKGPFLVLFPNQFRNLRMDGVEMLDLNLSLSNVFFDDFGEKKIKH